MSTSSASINPSPSTSMRVGACASKSSHRDEARENESHGGCSLPFSESRWLRFFESTRSTDRCPSLLWVRCVCLCPVSKETQFRGKRDLLWSKRVLLYSLTLAYLSRAERALASAKRSLFAAAAAAAAARCSARVEVGPSDRFPSRSMPVAVSIESMIPLNMPAIPVDFARPSACHAARHSGAGQRRAHTSTRHRSQVWRHGQIKWGARSVSPRGIETCSSTDASRSHPASLFTLSRMSRVNPFLPLVCVTQARAVRHVRCRAE